METRYFLKCSDCRKMLGDIGTHFVGNDKWCDSCYEKNFNIISQQIERTKNIISDHKNEIIMFEKELERLLNSTNKE